MYKKTKWKSTKFLTVVSFFLKIKLLRMITNGVKFFTLIFHC